MLTTNAATVMAAMQEYLDKRTVGGRADTVYSVTAIHGGPTTVYQFQLVGLEEDEEVRDAVKSTEARKKERK